MAAMMRIADRTSVIVCPVFCNSSTATLIDSRDKKRGIDEVLILLDEWTLEQVCIECTWNCHWLRVACSERAVYYTGFCTEGYEQMRKRDRNKRR